MNLVKTMFTVLTCMMAEFLTRAQCNELDECCYSYASVPRNETFCVPNGEQAQLNCVIINPHDNFTNLTVTWFRSTTEDMSEFDEISATSEEYRFTNFVSGSVDELALINCSHELHRDTFLLTILHFTQHKNGYYWCQLSINNTLVQPSHRAQFSAGNCSVTNQPYYRLASVRLSENRCAKYVATESDTGLTTHELSGTSFVASSTESSTRLSTVTQQERESDKTITYAATRSVAGITTTYKVSDISDSSITSLIESTRNVTTNSDAGLTTRSSSVAQQEKESDKSIIYVAGSLSALVMVLGALIIVLSVLYLCKFHNRVTTTSKPYQSHLPNTGNHGQSDARVTTASSTEAQASVQVTKSSEDDDVYSVVSDDSFDSHPDNQSSRHALPYEVAVFQGQSLSDGTQTLQTMSDSKAAALQPYDEVDYSNHNQQYRDSQTCTQISDEHHMYDEVNYKAKGQSKSIVSEIKDKKATTASELFDDIVYNVTLHAKSTKNVDEDHDTELNAPKKQEDQPTCKFDDEHVYESADQFGKGQTATPPTTNGDKDNKSGEADGTNLYHSLESSENGKFSNPDSHSMPIGHQRTIVQDSQSGPIQYKCQFDDPMYDSTPHPGVDPTVIANPKAELENDELVVQGNPGHQRAIMQDDTSNSLSGDCDSSMYNCQFDDPMYDSTPHPGVDLTVIADPKVELKNDELAAQSNLRGDTETLPSMFDDPTYGECHVGPNKQ